MTNNNIEIYWAPGTFHPEQESWALLYTEPKNLFSTLPISGKQKDSITSCPAVKNALKNVFSISAVINDLHNLQPDVLASLATTESNEVHIQTNGLIGINKIRKSSYEGFINIGYNMSWLFFASEPVEIKWTAPFFPAFSPTEDALLSPGQMNIGKWYRSINLDWHIPITATKFEIKKDKPLAFIEVLTDKKVTFHRYQMTSRLTHIAREMAQSPERYGRFKTLKERYLMASQSSIPEMVLKEIRANLV